VPQETQEEPEAEPVETVQAAPATPAAAPAQEQVATAQPPSSLAISGVEPTQEATDSEAWDGYGQMLYDMVERNKKYPQMAIRRHLEGRVIVSARISMGKLVEISLVDSSGHRVLDDQALEMVRRAASTLPVKNGLDKKSFNVLVPIDFKLQG
jgi:protein TonB